MSSQPVTIILSGETYDAVKREADLDGITVATLIDNLVNQHVENIEALSQMPRFTLHEYEMQRDPGESEETYQARLRLFC